MSGEDYLEAIYLLQRQKGTVRSVDVAHYMGYTKASVSRAVSLLKHDGLITVDSNGFLHLTQAGQEIATYIYDKHCTIAELLIQLGVSPETAQSDACRMEHSISDESFQRLKAWTQNRQALELQEG